MNTVISVTIVSPVNTLALVHNMISGIAVNLMNARPVSEHCEDSQGSVGVS